MPNCPTCGEKLTYLTFAQRCWVEWKVTASKKHPNNIDYSKTHKITDSGESEYICPHCKRAIDSIIDEETAYKFLKDLPYEEDEDAP